MPDLLRATRDKNRWLAEAVFHVFDLASYEFVYALSPSRRDLFFNSGYLPLADDFRPHPDYEAEAHGAMMYHFVGASQIAGLTSGIDSVLDVGCGQGGGLFYLAQLYPGARLTGSERARAAARLARRRLRGKPAEIIVTGTDSDGMAPGRFDLITGVGTPTYIGLTRFVTGAANALRPGGVVSLSGGYRRGDHAAVRAELAAVAETVGLELVRYDDIAAHTFAALKADIPRREAALARLPKPLRAYGRRWADLPGSPEYAEYEAGLRTDFAAVLQKPA